MVTSHIVVRRNLQIDPDRFGVGHVLKGQSDHLGDLMRQVAVYGILRFWDTMKDGVRFAIGQQR